MYLRFAKNATALYLYDFITCFNLHNSWIDLYNAQLVYLPYCCTFYHFSISAQCFCNEIIIISFLRIHLKFYSPWQHNWPRMWCKWEKWFIPLRSLLLPLEKENHKHQICRKYEHLLIVGFKFLAQVSEQIVSVCLHAFSNILYVTFSS